MDREQYEHDHCTPAHHMMRVAFCAMWIEHFAQPTDTRNLHFTAYSAKHAVTRWCGWYVGESHFQEAAEKLGYKGYIVDGQVYYQMAVPRWVIRRQFREWRMNPNDG